GSGIVHRSRQDGLYLAEHRRRARRAHLSLLPRSRRSGAETRRTGRPALPHVRRDASHRRAGDRARRAARAARPTRAGHRGDPAGRWQREPRGSGRGGLLHLDAGTDRHVPALLRPRGWRGHSHRLDHAVALSPSIATQWSGNYLDIIGDSLLTGTRPTGIIEYMFETGLAGSTFVARGGGGPAHPH